MASACTARQGGGDETNRGVSREGFQKPAAGLEVRTLVDAMMAAKSYGLPFGSGDRRQRHSKHRHGAGFRGGLRFCYDRPERRKALVSLQTASACGKRSAGVF